MTVQELINTLSQEKPDSQVYMQVSEDYKLKLDTLESFQSYISTPGLQPQDVGTEVIVLWPVAL